MFFKVHTNVRIDADQNFSFVVEQPVDSEEEAFELGAQAMRLSLAFVRGASSVAELQEDEDED